MSELRYVAVAAVAALGLAAHTWAGSPVVLTAENAEVVVAPKAAKLTRFAASEMTNFLSRVLGGDVPLVREPTKGRASIVLGENAWSRAAGIDLKDAPQDTFVVKAAGDRVFVVGRDDANYNTARVITPKGSPYDLIGHERATVHGAYDFLERYAGVRFYFPDDELGVVVPRKARIAVPEGERRVTPDFLLRDPYFYGDGSWHVKTCGGANPKAMHWLRLRLASTTIPCCHGSRDFKYIERFAKTHPEYLALKKDGSRWTDPNSYFAPDQYCWTNPGFRENLYQDVKAYLTGLPASSRGLKSWGKNCRFGKWVDIMPEDAFQGCFCDGCQAAYVDRVKGGNYASEMIWGLCAEIGNRLIRENVPGNITMMAYPPYRRVPELALPTNVWVMVAEGGPWTMTNPDKLAHDRAEIRDWAKKIGHKVWIWTYPSKFGEMMIKGVPCVGPHAWGRYYADLKDDIIGGFCECECDRSIYNFLNYYVYSRVMWDAATDIDATLDELYADLFGAAKGEMKRMFEELEERWTKRVVGNIVDTPVGPKTVRPDNRTLWGEIYSPAFRKELDGLLKAAMAKVGADSPEGRRIALMRAEFYDRMVEGAAEYESLMRGVESLRFEAAKGALDVCMRESGSRSFTNAATVATSVTAKRTADALEFTFKCIEPKMDLVSTAYMKPGDPDCWRDNTVELIFNPNGDGKTFFHYILTSAGNLAASRYVRGSGMKTDWGEGLRTGVISSAMDGAAGWTGSIRIPLALLGGAKDEFKINFCRHRALTDGTVESIVWSPYVHNFHDTERFGTIVFDK